MSALLKHRIRSSVLNWKLSIETDGKKDNSFKEDVFKELDCLIESIFKKHDGSVRRSNCHPIVDIWPMTARIIFKLHASICGRLRATPVTASPYCCSFTREVLQEVFGIISTNIINHNSFGHTSRSTPARVTISIHDKRKAIYLFNHMNDEGVKVEKDDLLKKVFADESCAKVLVSKEQPMILRYSKNSETLTISCHYGVWNSFQIAQH